MNSGAVEEALTKPVMIGGAAFQKSFQEWRLSHSNLYSAVAFLLLSLLALYSAEIPPVLRAQANTVMGRALLLVALYVLNEIGGWTLTVIGFVAVALVLAPTRDVLPPFEETGYGAPRASSSPSGRTTEGFSADVVAVRDVSDQPRWFVEKLMKERPMRIEEDRVLSQGNSS